MNNVAVFQSSSSSNSSANDEVEPVCEAGELHFVHEMRSEHPMNDPVTHAAMAVAG